MKFWWSREAFIGGVIGVCTMKQDPYEKDLRTRIDFRGHLKAPAKREVPMNCIRTTEKLHGKELAGLLIPVAASPDSF
jgi:hypothetical protein